MMPIRTYQDVMDLLQTVRSLCFVFITSDPDDGLPEDIPMAKAYIDDEPEGMGTCDFESFIVNRSDPDWHKIRERVEDIISSAAYATEKTYVLLDWEKSLADALITNQLTELFRPLHDRSISNFILPPRIQAFFES